MENLFQKASRKQKKLRLFLRGASGSGKTYSALMLAKGLVGPKGKIALIDTEKMSSTHYSDLVNFDVIDFNEHFDSHKPENYIKIIDMAEKQGYDVVIIDSFSHAWMGYGGILDINEFIAKSKFRGNSFMAWRVTTPDYYEPLVNKLVLNNNMHIIATGRVKTEYEVSRTDEGKAKVEKLGMKTNQREGVEYEFDTVLELQHGTEGIAVPDKDRTRIISPRGEKITVETGQKFMEYLKT